MKSDVKSLYDELNKLYGEQLPKQVATDILNHIPRELGDDEDAYGKYVYLTQVYTFGEYSASLSLFDKCYESRIHSYGEKEELIYSYLRVTPGVIKDHKIRNNKGLFNHTTETTAPGNLKYGKSNIYLIRRTIWDSLKYDKKMVTYTIYIYNHNNFIEESRKKQSQDTLQRMKESYNEAVEKGSFNNGLNQTD